MSIFSCLYFLVFAKLNGHTSDQITEKGMGYNNILGIVDIEKMYNHARSTFGRPIMA